MAPMNYTRLLSQYPVHLLFAAIVLFSASAASAGLVIVDSADRGWIRNDGTVLTTVNGANNYAVGSTAAGLTFNNFGVFDLSALPTDLEFASAAIVIYNPVRGWGTANPPGSQTYEMHEVSSDPTLFLSPPANAVAGTGLHIDLGDGAIFSSRDFTSADSGKFISMELNPAGLSALRTKLGGLFAIGGKLAGPEPVSGRSLFAFSGILNPAPGFELFTPANFRLEIATVPEPTTFLLVASTASALWLRYRRGPSSPQSA